MVNYADSMYSETQDSQGITRGFVPESRAWGCWCPKKNDSFIILTRALIFMRKQKQNYIGHVNVKQVFLA